MRAVSLTYPPFPPSFQQAGRFCISRRAAFFPPQHFALILPHHPETRIFQPSPAPRAAHACCVSHIPAHPAILSAGRAALHIPPRRVFPHPSISRSSTRIIPKRVCFSRLSRHPRLAPPMRAVSPAPQRFAPIVPPHPETRMFQPRVPPPALHAAYAHCVSRIPSISHPFSRIIPKRVCFNRHPRLAPPMRAASPAPAFPAHPPAASETPMFQLCVPPPAPHIPRPSRSSRPGRRTIDLQDAVPLPSFKKKPTPSCARPK